MLDDVSREAVQAEAYVDLVACPERRAGHPRGRHVTQPAICFRPSLAEPRQKALDLAAGVRRRQRRQLAVGDPDRLRVRAIDGVFGLQGVPLLDRDHVNDDLPDRPLPCTRRAVEQGGREPDEQGTKAAERALRQREDAPRFGVLAGRHAHVHFLRVLERAVERIPDVHLPPAKLPRARERLFVERSASSQRRVVVAHSDLLVVVVVPMAVVVRSAMLRRRARRVKTHAPG